MVGAFGDNVILEIIERADLAKDEAASRIPGFEISVKAQGQPTRGIVYAISPLIKSPEIQIGDVVIFNKQDIFQGFKADDKDLVAVKYNEIMGKVKT